MVDRYKIEPLGRGQGHAFGAAAGEGDLHPHAFERAPVVVLTTTDDKLEIQRCYDLGCNVYITKPVNYENFADAIRQLGLFLAVIQVPDIPEG